MDAATCAFLAVLIAGTTAGEASAASAGISFSGQVTRDTASGLSPLSAETVSFVNEAGFRLILSNPGENSQQMRLRIYEGRSRLVDAETFPSVVTLDAGASSEVTAIVPFDGAAIREITICAERIVAGRAERQACGRYTMRRLSLD